MQRGAERCGEFGERQNAAGELRQDQLAPGDSWTYEASYRVEESDICSCIVNNATVNAFGPCSNVSNSSGDVKVEIIYEPGIDLEKLSDKSGEKVDAGDTINFV